jgi:hypothetical protein
LESSFILGEYDMSRSVTRYLTKAAHKPSRLMETPDSRQLSISIDRSTALTFLGLAVAAMGIMAGYYFGPELARYIKMSRM